MSFIVTTITNMKSEQGWIYAATCKDGVVSMEYIQCPIDAPPGIALFPTRAMTKQAYDRVRKDMRKTVQCPKTLGDVEVK